MEREHVESISRFLGISPDSFLTRYCETRNGRLYIITGKDGYCIFHDKEKQCLIHPVNPPACSLWPFYPAIVKDKHTWEMAKEACPGINPDCSFEEFVRQAKRRDV